MRKIVLDTETTGLDVASGHRIIEIGAIELINYVPTEKQFHQYINPHRAIDSGAFEVHGLSETFLSDFPPFSEIVAEFIEFIGSDDLIIHNAPFDIGFINSELARGGHSKISKHRLIDTLAIARKRYPGAQASLNALCRRFEINNSHRNLHGALVDADLLAAVYLELIGGKQPGFTLTRELDSLRKDVELSLPKERRAIRTFQPTQEELSAHSFLVERIANPIWKN